MSLDELGAIILSREPLRSASGREKFQSNNAFGFLEFLHSAEIQNETTETAPCLYESTVGLVRSHLPAFTRPWFR